MAVLEGQWREELELMNFMALARVAQHLSTPVSSSNLQEYHRCKALWTVPGTDRGQHNCQPVCLHSCQPGWDPGSWIPHCGPMDTVLTLAGVAL